MDPIRITVNMCHYEFKSVYYIEIPAAPSLARHKTARFVASFTMKFVIRTHRQSPQIARKSLLVLLKDIKHPRYRSLHTKRALFIVDTPSVSVISPETLTAGHDRSIAISSSRNMFCRYVAKFMYNISSIFGVGYPVNIFAYQYIDDFFGA